MTSNLILQCVFYLVVLILLAKPLGLYMARIFEGQPALLNTLGAPVERLIYRVSGIDEKHEMHWTQYALAALAFNLIGFLRRLRAAALPGRPAAQPAEPSPPFRPTRRSTRPSASPPTPTGRATAARRP